MAENEIIFEVREDDVDDGYTARNLGHSIFTEGETIEELRKNVLERRIAIPMMKLKEVLPIIESP